MTNDKGMIFNTHYNILDALIMADPDLVLEVGERVKVLDKLESSVHASAVFSEWWDEHQTMWHPSERAAIYTIWEVVYWAKGEFMNGIEGKTWWEMVKPRIAA